MPAAHEARTYAPSLPVVPVRARGLTIEGADGRRYLDCLSGGGSLALGHNHPVVLDAIRSVLDSGAPLHAPGPATPAEDAFTAELLCTLPVGFADGVRVQFCGPAGADAGAAALRLARAATGRTGLLALAGTERLTGGVEGSDGAEEPAAVTVAPVLAGGGAAAARDAWLRRVRELTAERGIPLIADETETGVGRTGAFWAVEHSGVVPDAMVLAKAVGGSLPLAVVVHRKELGEAPPAACAGACRGNQLAMAAGAATLKYVRERRLAQHAARLGERMLGGLRELAARHACVREAHGRGLLLGVELVSSGAGDPAAAVQRACLERGLIVGAADVPGAAGGVIRLQPPLTLTEEQADAVLDRLADALTSVKDEAGAASSVRDRPRGGAQ